MRYYTLLIKCFSHFLTRKLITATSNLLERNLCSLFKWFSSVKILFTILNHCITYTDRLRNSHEKKNRLLNAFVINESLQTFQKPPASWLLGWGTRSGHFLWRLFSVWRVHTSPVSPPCFEPLRSGRHLSVSLKTSVLFQCLCLGRCVWTWKHTCMQTQKIKVRARF